MIGLQNPAMLALLLAATPVVYTAYKAEGVEERAVSSAKIATIVLLAIGAASPYIPTTEKVSKNPTVTVLEDRSVSTELMKEYELDLEGVEIQRKTIAAGNNSELRQGIIRSIEEDTPYLVVSDGQAEETLKGLESRFRRKNATLHALEPEMRTDASVSIEGPSSTVLGAENSYQIKIESTNGTHSPLPKVTVDGEEVDIEEKSEGIYGFTRKFSTEQDHTIKASIGIDDSFKSNNRFFKTVEVTEKPEVLVLGNRGGLESELEEFYDLTYRGSVPEDLSDYYAVIAKKQFDEEELAGYITEGNGLVYTGDYGQENDILPIEQTERRASSSSANTIITIDNSGAIRTEGGRSQIKDASEIILGSLDDNNRVGAVAYKGIEPKAEVLDPRSLAEYRGNIAAWINNLKPEGYSPHEIGLNVSRKIIGDNGGNIILITDGELPRPPDKTDIDTDSFKIVEEMDAELIIVGVGEEEPAHGGERFLEQLDRRPGVQYYQIEDIINSRGDTKIDLSPGGGAKESSSLVVVKKDHFITQGISTNAEVEKLDTVRQKPAAEQLVKTSDGFPALSTWRYGLGRVAAYSAGGKDLGRVSSNDPELVSRSISWAVGAPERKEERRFNVVDARQGETVQAEASYNVEGLNRQGENLYTAELRPENFGFHEFEGEIYGYNYPEELEQVGYNGQLESLVKSTGGKTFASEEEQEIINELKKFSNREIQTQKPLSDYFIVAALLIFLSEAGYRKLKGRK